MPTSVELRKSVPVVDEVDVLVVGAGIAGATAAVTAAREGARTMVVDRFSRPGGGIGPGLIGGAPNLELPKSMLQTGLPGVPGEFVRRCESYTNAQLFNNYFRDSEVISYVWLRMMEESGVELMLNTFAGDPIMEGNRINGLLVENKSGTQAVMAKVVIDATGDADVVARAGAPVDNGSGNFGPGLYFAMNSVDVERYQEERRASQPSEEDIRWAKGLHRVVVDRFHHLKWLTPYYRKAWESGDYEFLRHVDGRWTIYCNHGFFKSVSGYQYVADPLQKGKYGIVGSLVGVDGPWDRKDLPTSGSASLMNRLDVESRKYAFETARFLVKYIPGFEDAYLHFVSPYFHARGGRSMVSECPLTEKDVEEERKKDDVILLGHKHVLFGLDGDIEAVTGNKVFGFTPAKTYDFPYRQLLPRKVDGLLAAGRSAIISGQHRARRMIFLMGEAAGVAAALAARSGKNPRDIDVKQLQRTLYRKYGMPMGDAARIAELGLQ